MTDDVNYHLSPRSKLLLKLHYKLGHVGFQHLRFLLKTFKLFGTQGLMAADKDTETPLCSSCITGGMQRKPVAPGQNVHTQKGAKKVF